MTMLSVLIVLSYIFILHQTTTMQPIEINVKGCLISSFYIKPQLTMVSHVLTNGCLISSFYIKPQLLLFLPFKVNSCLISSFYIKPQPANSDGDFGTVVLYLHSTSNHNSLSMQKNYFELSYIFILHQTTTHCHQLIMVLSCLISSFYIKPQRSKRVWLPYRCCLISSFYIKPQQSMEDSIFYTVVLYLHSTSNHNGKR